MINKNVGPFMVNDFCKYELDTKKWFFWDLSQDVGYKCKSLLFNSVECVAGLEGDFISS